MLSQEKHYIKVTKSGIFFGIGKKTVLYHIEKIIILQLKKIDLKNISNKWITIFLIVHTIITEWFIIANAIRHW